MNTAAELLKKAATSLLLIFLVALAARLGFAWNQERKIPREVIGTVAFEQETGSIAYSLATGRGFSSPFRRETGPTAWLTPVYPLMVAGIFRVFGIFTANSFFAVVVLNALFSSLASIPIFQVGKKLGGLGVASTAAWLWALYPNAVMMPFEWVWDTCLAALLGAALLWATLKVVESQSHLRDWCAYGLLWGFTLMTNPSLSLLLPFLLAWTAFHSHRAVKLSFRYPALALGIAILCCVPWTVRNYIVFRKFVPLRSNFPLEFYIGNNNTYETRQFVWPPKITKERELLRYFRLGESAFMEEEGRKAWEFIRAHPGIAIELIGEKFVAFWTGIAQPVDAFKTADSLLVRVLLLCNAITALGALLGLVVLFAQRSPYRIPIATYVLVFPWLYYITHANLRYRHPIDPVVLLLDAVALAVWRLMARRKSQSTSISENAAEIFSGSHRSHSRLALAGSGTVSTCPAG